MEYNNYQQIIANIDGHVLHIQLNRSESKNAIGSTLAAELSHAVKTADEDKNIHVILLSGNSTVFSVGADLKEMQNYTNISQEDAGSDTSKNTDFLASWDILSKISKPIIACVNGYALGGGCEIALMCDIIVAGSDAHFSQPEIKVGLLPGAGGTQRIVRSVGKAHAMDICLSGRLITAFEALNMGMISRVTEPQDTLKESMELANTIASYSIGAVIAIKKSIQQSFENRLSLSLEQERTAFYARLQSKDAHEGISAFIEKRTANFVHD